jgi:putative ABC transport system permease protein
MEFRPIVSALLRNKIGAILIALQIAITLAVITNAVFIIQQRIERIATPSGVDEANSFVLFTSFIDESIDYVQQTREDLAQIRAMPGVIAATSINAITTSGSGWGESIYLDPEDPDSSFNFGQYLTDEHGLEALDLEMVDGRFFRAEEIQVRERNDPGYPDIMVISKTLADAMFPDKSAVGQRVYDDELSGPTTIIGVYDDLKSPWPNSDNYTQSAIIGQQGNWDYKAFFVRAEPGQRDALMARVEELLAGNLDRIIHRMRSMEEIKQNTYSGDNAMVVLLTGVVVLLSLITALGIVGLAWFSVSRRRKSIGTRRALGARKVDILRYFMLENWIITSAGLVVGVALTIGLNYTLDNAYQIGRIPLWYVPAGMAMLWALGQLAVLAPARRAAAISPALATRSV